MRRSFVMACALSLVHACASGSGGDTPGPGVDAGRGGGMLDAGSGGGGGGGSDAGSGGGGGGTDAGSTRGACVGANSDTMWASLSAACLPRCSAATSRAVSDCAGDGMCVANALMADTTPGVAWSLNGTARPEPMDCANCFDYQYLSCAHTVCQAETNAMRATCRAMPMSAACDGAYGAMNACLMANDAAFGACANERIGGCFATSGGGGGGGGADAGTPTTACVGANSDTMWAPLSAACVPRCSATTSRAVSDCFGDELCIADALRADTTPGVPWTLNGTRRPEPMDCANCYDYQYLSCAHLVCRAETNAWRATCRAMPMSAACNAAYGDIMACISFNDAEFGACADARVGACFGAGGGAGFLEAAGAAGASSSAAEHAAQIERALRVAVAPR